MYRGSAIAAEQGEMMHFARTTGFNDQSGRRAQSFAYQMLMDRTDGEQRGYRHIVNVDLAVGHDQEVITETQRIFCVCAQRRDCRFNAFGSPCSGISDIQFVAAEVIAREHIDMADFLHIIGSQYRMRHLQPLAGVGVMDIKQIWTRADRDRGRHHQFLANRIDWRIGYLREQLFEIVIEVARFV